MRFIFFAALLPLLFSACSLTTTNHYTPTVKSWHGATLTTLEKRWGEPDSKIVNPNGTTIYVYRTESYGMLPSHSQAGMRMGVHVNRGGNAVVINTTAKNARKRLALTCLAVFEANVSGKIIRTEVRGNECYGSPEFASNQRNPAQKHNPNQVNPAVSEV